MANPNLCTHFILSFLSLIIICNADASKGTDNPKYSYDDGSSNGPKKWGSLSTEFKSCSDGESQSPIDIEVQKAKDQPNDLKRAYKLAPAKLVHKGHTIAVEWEGDAGGIVVNGSTYKLIQCHWHTPAEHTIDGKRYDAELHLVHGNDKDQKAVIGILFDIGEPDPFIEKLSESKFREIGSNGNDLGKVSASSITGGNKKYFRYNGSLTTPPCSDGVIWTVSETVKSISQDQIKLLKLKGPLANYFEENARPIQELNGRTVTRFEDEGGTGEDTGKSGTESSSILLLRNGIVIMLVLQMYILFLF